MWPPARSLTGVLQLAGGWPTLDSPPPFLHPRTNDPTDQEGWHCQDDHNDENI
jgi:hypothetical protein